MKRRGSQRYTASLCAAAEQRGHALSVTRWRQSRAYRRDLLHLSNDAVPYHFVCRPYRASQIFGDIAGHIFKRIEACERQSRTLVSIRDTTLPKLLLGKPCGGKLKGLIEEAT